MLARYLRLGVITQPRGVWENRYNECSDLREVLISPSRTDYQTVTTTCALISHVPYSWKLYNIWLPLNILDCVSKCQFSTNFYSLQRWKIQLRAKSNKQLKHTFTGLIIYLTWCTTIFSTYIRWTTKQLACLMFFATGFLIREI